jgi:hypothetical protein
MDINEAAAAIEGFLRSYASGGVHVAAVEVRPSGDDVDVIKIRLDVGDAAVDRAWTTACEEAIRAAVPEASGFRLQVRAG